MLYSKTHPLPEANTHTQGCVPWGWVQVLRREKIEVEYRTSHLSKIVWMLFSPTDFCLLSQVLLTKKYFILFDQGPDGIEAWKERYRKSRDTLPKSDRLPGAASIAYIYNYYLLVAHDRKVWAESKCTSTMHMHNIVSDPTLKYVFHFLLCSPAVSFFTIWLK